MSRIGKLPITIPSAVNISIKDHVVTVNGPKGELTRAFSPEMIIEMENGTLSIRRPSDSPSHKALHGLTRSLLANMVEGVTNGFSKKLTIIGVGYRAELSGKSLTLRLGYSHPITVEPPEGITFSVDKNGTEIVVSGSDKEVVGQVAANIRGLRPPEPYKGKGVRYENENVRQKAGKSGKK
ncbi:MAG: 50S ribosomal protein L6 [Gemmatimonadetes bacterium]|nr:MAG: 50S ribosomal protein L6 [Gemmatimonadota bacterium]